MCFNNPKPEMLADREIKMNQARWDYLLPVLFVTAYSFAMVWFGYVEGKRVAEEKAEKTANLNRMQIAQDKQLYDWERHGL
jgi:hypothetical protein